MVTTREQKPVVGRSWGHTTYRARHCCTSNFQSNLKIFFIKLVAITFSVIIIINVVFNLLIGDKVEKINNFLSLDKSKFRNDFKNKIRNEIRNGLDKENILNQEDKILLFKLYKKIEKEFADIENKQ